MKAKDLSWENLTREVELPPYREWGQLSTPDRLDYAKGYGKGMTSMKKMVLSVLREHPQMSIQEVARYIRENL